MRYTFILLLAIAGTALAQNKTQLTNLPTIYIDTHNKVGVNSKDIYVYATMTYLDGDSVAVYDSLRIRGRGNSTWNFAKKPYRIKFNHKEKFLGKGYANAKDWTLMANTADKTLIRNAVASEMSEFVGLDFSPARKFVDFYLNGQYLGNYQISDQVELQPHRVDVEEQDYPLTPTSNITGGYLLEIDGFGTSEPNYFRTSRNLIITVKYPDEDEVAASQNTYIRNYINSLEAALFGSNFRNPLTGYRAFIDEESLINWYIATEYTANVDGFWSTYIYKQVDDPNIYFGPMWDHDIAFNNCNRVGDVTNRLMMDAGFGTDLTKVWVQRMWQDPWFANAVNTRWKQLVESGITQHLLDYTDEIAAHIDQSQIKNFAKKGNASWTLNQRVYNEITLYSTYQEGVNYLKKFLAEHATYLTQAFASRAPSVVDPPEDPEIKIVPFVPDETFYYRIMNKGVNKLFDLSDADTTKIVMWSALSEKPFQQWAIDSVAGSNGQYVRIWNSSNRLALTDVAAAAGNGYSTGSQIEVAPLDSLNDRQVWQLAPLLAGGEVYNIINKQTNLALNNSGGGQADGNRIISYTNDGRNQESTNRQYYFEKTVMRPEPTPGDGGLDGINSPNAPQYALLYNPDTRILRFAAEATSIETIQELPETQVHIYTAAGMLVRTFSSEEEEYVGDLPKGTYVISWNDGTVRRSVKLVL